MALEGVIEPFEAVEDAVTKMGRSCLHVPDPRHLWMVGHDDDRASSSISAVKPRGLDLVELQRVSNLVKTRSICRLALVGNH